MMLSFVQREEKYKCALLTVIISDRSENSNWEEQRN